MEPKTAKVYALGDAGYKRAVDIVQALTSAVPQVRLSAGAADRLAYSRDLWPRRLLEVRAGRAELHRPAAVVWPRHAQDVAELVRFARREGVALVPFGAGSGVCGAILPDDRTIVLDLKSIDDFSIDRDAPLIDVGSGAMGITLEEDVERQGFTIGHFPSSILCSTPGGWIAARGAGQCSGLYGKIEDMVVSAECVLGTGEIVTLRRRFDGPNMVPLVIGSEGTLCIVTRSKLRLHPAPRARAFESFQLSSIEAGWEAMRRVFQAGLRPAVSRLYDPIDSTIMKSGSVRSGRRRSIASGGREPGLLGKLARGLLRAPRLLNRLIEAAEGNLLGGSTLIFVLEGTSDTVHPDAERLREIVGRAGGRHLGEGPARTWLSHRYSVSYRQAPVFRLGAFSDTMEVAAPWSRLGDLYDGVRRALGRHVLVMAHLSHAYPDGCSIYFTFSGAARDDEAALATYDSAWRDALSAAIECGGTLSHHHGVGRAKASHLGDELGHGVEVVRRLMRAWDPDGILNPGNLLPQKPKLRETAPEPPFVPGEIDVTSLLATFGAATTLAEIEAHLEARDLTLGLDAKAPFGKRLDAWIAAGLPGIPDPWADPVSQALAGWSARLGNGARVVARPVPRRAVGPDLSALFVGAGDRIGKIEQATLLVRRRGDQPARTLPYHGERNPKLDDAERAAWERLVAAF